MAPRAARVGVSLRDSPQMLGSSFCASAVRRLQRQAGALLDQDWTMPAQGIRSRAGAAVESRRIVPRFSQPQLRDTWGWLACILLRFAALLPGKPPVERTTPMTIEMAPDSDQALRFRGVSMRYGSAAALQDFGLAVREGQIFGLVGMNGAGKTTLIKCLLDFAEPDSGSIQIFGVSHRLTRARHRLTFLPERFTPPYYLTGRDFLRYMLQLQELDYRPDDVERTFAGLDLDISALAKPVRAFSKGMTQKLGLAACLLSRKDLYVLDEPTSGLDPKARALLKQRLREVRDQGRTIFLTSHALADVDEVCDNMAVIHRGELRFAGTPAQLRAHHVSDTLEQAFLACIDERPPLAA